MTGLRTARDAGPARAPAAADGGHGASQAPRHAPTELSRWLAGLSSEALERLEQLHGAMPALGRDDDGPMTDFERGVIECATLDAAEPGSYLHEPAEARAWLDDWITGVDRVFMSGADVRGWLSWHDVKVDQLGAGELARLVALLAVLEDHPVEGAATSTDVIWCAVGEHGQRKRQGLV